MAIQDLGVIIPEETSLLVLNDHTQSAGSATGQVIVMGNASYNNFSVAQDLNQIVINSDITLAVNNNMDITGGTNYIGNTSITDSSNIKNYSMNNSNASGTTQPIESDFFKNFPPIEYFKCSASIHGNSSGQSQDSLNVTGTTLTFTPTDPSMISMMSFINDPTTDTQRFSVNMNDIKTINYVVPDNSTVVFNIRSFQPAIFNNITQLMNGNPITKEQAQRVLWIFHGDGSYNPENFEITFNTDFWGSISAINSTINAGDYTMYGTLIAKNLTGNLNVVYNPFRGELFHSPLSTCPYPTCSISGSVFYDTNGNGFLEPEDIGIEGVSIELYDSSNSLINTSTSSSEGTYSFSSLASGNYTLKFIPSIPYTLTIQQLEYSNGSKPNPSTGFTNIISLSLGENPIDILAGVVRIPATIGGTAFIDINEDGLYDTNDPLANNITAKLYTANDVLIESKVINGSYNFNNLKDGSYYIEFIPTLPQILTIQQSQYINGSKPNQLTGKTDNFTLALGDTVSNMHVGVIPPCKAPTINATDKSILVGDIFDPIIGVIAMDCKGTNITSNISIISNNVNTNMPGLYNVTYSVTDSRGTTVTKTINVVVRVPYIYQQVLTDLIESIALEKTALSHIINAEGEKLQTIINNYATDIDDLLNINKSVENTLSSIANLDFILKRKLDIAQNSISKNN